MDESHQNATNNNLTTTENKIWLPPSFTNNNKIPTSNNLTPTQIGKQNKRSHGWKWGFTNKTGWDWLNLVGILLVPLMIGIFTVVSSIQQAQIIQKQHDTDIQIALDQEHETTLKSYLADIKDLQLNRGLKASKPGDEIRVLAQTETLSTLRQLDSGRKGILMQFVSDSGLITSPIGGLQGDQIINLSSVDLGNTDMFRINLFGAVLSFANLNNSDLFAANLNGADLNSVNLEGAHLGLTYFDGADMIGADLKGTDLSTSFLRGADLGAAELEGADLHLADLQGADLSNADLTGAKISSSQLAQVKSLKGTTMPDGSIHP